MCGFEKKRNKFQNVKVGLRKMKKRPKQPPNFDSRREITMLTVLISENHPLISSLGVNSERHHVGEMWVCC